jgi:hypothetical protein
MTSVAVGSRVGGTVVAATAGVEASWATAVGAACGEAPQLQPVANSKRARTRIAAIALERNFLGKRSIDIAVTSVDDVSEELKPTQIILESGLFSKIRFPV